MILLYKKNNKCFVQSSESYLSLNEEEDNLSDLIFAKVIASSEYESLDLDVGTTQILELVEDEEEYPEGKLEDLPDEDD